VLKVREDKEWQSAMTYTQLQQVIADFQNNLNVEKQKRRLYEAFESSDDDTIVVRKKTKKVVEKPTVVMK
jgi:hypothetical protein